MRRFDTFSIVLLFTRFQPAVPGAQGFFPGGAPRWVAGGKLAPVANANLQLATNRLQLRNAMNPLKTLLPTHGRFSRRRRIQPQPRLQGCRLRHSRTIAQWI